MVRSSLRRALTRAAAYRAPDSHQASSATHITFYYMDMEPARRDDGRRQLARSSGAPAAPVGSLGPAPTPILAPEEAARMPPLDLIASEGVLSIGGNPNATFVFKGVTWHGTDLGPMVPSGLRVHSLDHYLAFLQSWGFNSIRLPFDHERVIKNAIVKDDLADELLFAPELLALPYSHVLLAVAKAAARRGMLVVLACAKNSLATPPGAKGAGHWVSDAVSEELAMRSWQRLAHALCGQWNVVGADLFAQPYKASWGAGDLNSDCERKPASRPASRASQPSQPAEPASRASLQTQCARPDQPASALHALRHHPRPAPRPRPRPHPHPPASGARARRSVPLAHAPRTTCHRPRSIPCDPIPTPPPAAFNLDLVCSLCLPYLARRLQGTRLPSGWATTCSSCAPVGWCSCRGWDSSRVQGASTPRAAAARTYSTWGCSGGRTSRGRASTPSA